ncbi:hypothetical protein FJT64_009115 [Amphibalanus amphitrite]|uniref:Uncharacterized protein n=1 Tax=Amphibalanus amphitrite TaxID=1232801 RepID=A0A6A4V9Q3_AMPAM|nr:uncharacterized protein LOC122380214 [Amphibalanus amphitrite]KAF0292997.1 hypothetical protein FJT64_009115 [Amphibalanus amphitrite]
MALQKKKEFGSTSSIGSRGSLSNLLKDGVDNLEDSVTKKWLSWILRRHVRSSVGRISTDEANGLADTAAQLARELVCAEGLDVLKLDDQETLYHDSFLFFRFTASLAFRATSVSGLESLRRQGDAILELDGDWLTLQTALTVDLIQCRSVCSAKLLDIGPRFELRGQLDSATIKTKARINTATTQVIVCTCEIVHLGELSISESGDVFRVLPAWPGDPEEADGAAPFPFTSLLAVVSELFAWRCRDQVTCLLEAEAPRVLREALQRTDLAAVVSSFGRSYFRSAVEAGLRRDSGAGGGASRESVSTAVAASEPDKQ